ncbi:MAG: transposase [Elusimicrobiota bacterium]
MNDKEKPQQDAEVFVKAVKRQTRKKFTAEEKIRIVLEGMKRDVSVAELCRREGIPSAAYYSWTKDFLEGGKAQLQRDARRHADASGVEKLKKEKVNLWVYGTPEDLQAAITRMVEAYNDTPHEALKNVISNDVYAGRKDEVLERRAKPRSSSRRWLGVMRIIWARTPEPQTNSG